MDEPHDTTPTSASEEPFLVRQVRKLFADLGDVLPGGLRALGDPVMATPADRHNLWSLQAGAHELDDLVNPDGYGDDDEEEDAL